MIGAQTIRAICYGFAREINVPFSVTRSVLFRFFHWGVRGEKGEVGVCLFALRQAQTGRTDSIERFSRRSTAVNDCEPRRGNFCGVLDGTGNNGGEISVGGSAKERYDTRHLRHSGKSTTRTLNSGGHNYSCSGRAQSLINCALLH